MCFALNISFEKLFLRLNDELSNEQKDEYLKLCERLSLGSLLSILVGYASF